jgi:hypothetical protein
VSLTGVIQNVLSLPIYLPINLYGGLISLWLYKEVRKEVVVRRGQIRLAGRVFQNFKVKICQFLVRNGRLVRNSIVLKKQDSFRKPKTYQHPYVPTSLQPLWILTAFSVY